MMVVMMMVMTRMMMTETRLVHTRNKNDSSNEAEAFRAYVYPSQRVRIRKFSIR